MDTQTRGTEGNTPEGGESPVQETPPVDKQPALDLLRRVFIPIERRTEKGTIVFRTTDNTMYARVGEGMPIHRVVPKVNGKKARKARRVAYEKR